MSAVHVHPRWVLWWGIWAAQVFMSLATVNIPWMRACWIQFALAEGLAVARKRPMRMPDGAMVQAGNTLSETSTWFSLFAKPASKWWQGWRGAVSLFQLPIMCAHFFVTMAWGPAGLHPWWWLFLVPTVGLYFWLIYHFLNVTKHG